jgi:hypothetical protein
VVLIDRGLVVDDILTVSQEADIKIPIGAFGQIPKGLK